MRVVVTGLAVAMWLVAGAASAQDAKVQAGMKVYDAQKCGMCHAVAGKGNAKNPLDGVGAKLSDAQIKEWIVAPAEAAKKANSTAEAPDEGLRQAAGRRRRRARRLHEEPQQEVAHRGFPIDASACRKAGGNARLSFSDRLGSRVRAVRTSGRPARQRRLPRVPRRPRGQARGRHVGVRRRGDVRRVGARAARPDVRGLPRRPRARRSCRTRRSSKPADCTTCHDSRGVRQERARPRGGGGQARARRAPTVTARTTSCRRRTRSRARTT